MAERRSRNSNKLSERMVRNEDIFCSLLFDSASGTIRVVDFRGGNFQTKHAYLERVLIAEGMRKIFTLIERDDMNGWQRVGYMREGTIPGYYKRSDAYIMSRIYDEDWEGADAAEDGPERKEMIARVKENTRQFTALKGSGIKAEQVDEDEAIDQLRGEYGRLAQAAKKARAPKKGAKGRRLPSATALKNLSVPVFPQFSREVEYYFFVAQNRRTKQLNLFGAEYQDCFGNAKIDVQFSPTSKTERSLALTGLNAFIDWLGALGAVALFSLVPSGDEELNALFAAAGFRNSGWLNRQRAAGGGYLDLVLWTRKLV